MKHQVWERELPEMFEVAVLGPSCALRGTPAEPSLRRGADCLVFRGSAASLAAVRLAFAGLPGVFAAGVVRAVDLALAPPPSQSDLFPPSASSLR